MKVIIFSHEHPKYKLGGAGQVALNMSKAQEGVSLVTQNYFRKIKILYLIVMYRTDCSEKRVVLNDPLSVVFMVIIDAFRHRRSLSTVVYIHGLESRLAENSVLGFFWRKTYRVAAKKYTFAFVSDYIRREWKRRYTLNLKRSLVVHNGVDYDDIVLKEGLRKEFWFSASRIVKEKGFEEMKNFLELKARELGIKQIWKIAGEGDYAKNLFSTDYVQIDHLGRLENSEVKALMAECKGFLMLSNYDEACPLGLLEALSLNTRIITYSNSGMGEIARLYGNSVIIERNNPSLGPVTINFIKKPYSTQAQLNLLVYDTVNHTEE